MGYNGAQVLDITGPMELLSAANVAPPKLGKPRYEVSLLARKAGLIETSGAIRLHADASFVDYDAPIDMLMVSGGEGTLQALEDTKLIDFIARATEKAARVVSICSGAFLLAEAGLLDGRRATTHWNAAKYFRRLYPQVMLEPDALYVRDGDVWTSAGVTAGMDLTLALISEDFGREVALEIARKNVMFAMRTGGQSQFSAHLVATTAPEGPVGKVMNHIVSNPAHSLTLPELADMAHMSERTFLRHFQKITGDTPAKFVEVARIDAARRKLEQLDLPLTIIAFECGFGSAERMRRSFQRHLGVTPQDYRSRFAPTPQLKTLELV
ncbi:MAG: GlxA family transcriptional regulator [Alphaproteobacteria bacterium]|nr:MAG: GlxA family transcriptional regulator [Alphaproteobacteria bacterium]